MMPGMDGIQLLRKAFEIDPLIVGIIMTGQGTVPTAVEAMKVGAFDYIQKPFKLQSILPVLNRAMEVRQLRLENVRLKRHVDRLTFESSRFQMVGESASMRGIVRMIEKVAPTEATVLICGPSGSGKELVARALHFNSDRRDKPMVTVNCAALQETLLESELFGHEKGSFTGATGPKRGLFEVAEGGTLFVDEIAEMSPGMQAKMLRVLEDRSYRRVGGTKEIEANVRVLAATNKVLEEEQKKGRFREDLFYRLNVIAIHLPTLAERREDIPALVEHFLKTRQLGRQRCMIDADALAILQHYDWPGNIRELVNVIERAQILAEDNRITTDDLPENLNLVAPLAKTDGAGENLTALRDVERRHVESVLKQAGNNKVQTAKLLGVSRRALYRLIAKYRLDGA
jgi:DNA-binding NtrC family response regulator